MSFKSAIAKAPIVYKSMEIRGTNKITTTIDVGISYEGKVFYGCAECHPEDANFFSEKFGVRLAEARARLNCVKYQERRLKENYKAIRKFYLDTVQGKDADPTNAFQVSLYRLENRLEKMRDLRRKQKEYIRSMIASQEKAINSIKAYRAAKIEQSILSENK